MDELFRLRIAAKRQVTIPQRLMDLLNLSVDDELWVETNGTDVRLVPMVQVPRSLVTPEFLKMLDEREQESKQNPLPEVSDGSTFTAQMKGMLAAEDLVHGRVRSPRVGFRGYRPPATAAAKELMRAAGKKTKAGGPMDEQNLNTVG